MSDKFSKIGELLRTQDNRITDQPMFIVEEKRRQYGIHEDYGQNFKWLNVECDYVEADEKEIQELEEKEDISEDTFPWEKMYYADDWHFVTACFTEQGCKDYLEIEGHNLKETRIYAHGSFRNEEYREVRAFLMDC